jgi:hypothetical protein
MKSARHFKHNETDILLSYKRTGKRTKSKVTRTVPKLKKELFIKLVLLSTFSCKFLTKIQLLIGVLIEAPLKLLCRTFGYRYSWQH